MPHLRHSREKTLIYKATISNQEQSEDKEHERNFTTGEREKRNTNICLKPWHDFQFLPLRGGSENLRV